MLLFKPKRGIKPTLITYAIFTAGYIPCFILLFYKNSPIESWLQFIAISYGLLTLLFILIQKTTYYSIKNGYFNYSSIFLLKGAINIENIHKLEVNKTSWVGNKPATATKGIIIHYNKYDDVYISPESNDDLVKELLKINPNIEVVFF